MTPENKEEIRRLRAGASDGEWEYDKHEQVVKVHGEFLFSLQGAKILDRKFILASKDIVDDLSAALEETERLLTNHGPQGHNYTNEQYVTLQQAFTVQQEKIKYLNSKLIEAQETIAQQHSLLSKLSDIAES